MKLRDNNPMLEFPSLTTLLTIVHDCEDYTYRGYARMIKDYSMRFVGSGRRAPVRRPDQQLTPPHQTARKIVALSRHRRRIKEHCFKFPFCLLETRESSRSPFLHRNLGFSEVQGARHSIFNLKLSLPRKIRIHNIQDGICRRTPRNPR